MAKIIPYPKVEKIDEEIKVLTEKLAALMLKRDSLLGHEKRELEAKYMAAIGIYELELFHLKIEALRLKRKLELIRQAENRGDIPDMVKIEEALDLEMQAYLDELERMKTSLENSLDWMSNRKPLTEDDSAELRKLYLKLVKRLHPDLNPNLTEEEKNLFNNVIEAYQNGDLMAMKMIEALVAVGHPEDEKEDELDFKVKKKQQLIVMCKRLEEGIESILQSFPFTQRDFLKNSILINKRKNELTDLIDQFENRIEEYKIAVAKAEEKYFEQK